jgi:hypothetical protein
MSEILNYLRRAWLLYTGRKKFAEPYVFSSREIISPAFFFHVSYLLKGIYLNLHPTLYAVCIWADGTRKKLEGGLNIPFPPGKSTLHYIDKTDRQSELLKITENTLDAARITLAVKITYRISEPIKVFEIQEPVETLFSMIQADMKEYIRTRQYEDLIGNDDSQVIDSGMVAKYIKQQHGARYPISKVFAIIDVIVQEKEGDPVFIEKRKSYKSQMVDGESKMKIQELNKKIASQDAEMEQLRYQYKAVLEQQKATADVQQNAIRQKIPVQELEIQKMRDEWQQKQDAWRQKQEKWMRSMDAIDSAFKSQSPYLREEAEGLISAIVNELRGLAQSTDEMNTPISQPDAKSDPPKQGSDKLDTLTDRLFSLLDRRKPE